MNAFNPFLPLRDYVRKPDTSFTWKKESERELPGGVTLTEITFTSQTWQGIRWTHRLSALQPKEMKAKPTALLYITGNYRASEAPFFAPLVVQAKQPLFILWDIPNQPLFDGLNEDALISYTFVKYLETQDPTWPLLFPMTKGAVRAMDAAEAVAKQEWKASLNGFVVTGASKRGWTTWLTGAVDPRVRGIAPMVFDNLNFGAQMQHQIASWGKYSEQIQDYTERGLQEQMETETGKKLTAMVDPYHFRQRIRVPKLIINGTNDRYWTLDAARFYYDDLTGPKDLLYVPNAGHGLQDFQRVLGGIAAFWQATSASTVLPPLRGEFSRIEEGGSERLQLMIRPGGIKPVAIRAWWATSETRDFRETKWEAVPAKSPVGSGMKSDAPGVHWMIVPKTLAQPGAYAVASLTPPEGKYAAMFAEVEYAGEPGVFHLSTQVGILGPEEETVTPGASTKKE